MEFAILMPANLDSNIIAYIKFQQMVVNHFLHGRGIILFMISSHL
jgi:hypothetical protein